MKYIKYFESHFSCNPSLLNYNDINYINDIVLPIIDKGLFVRVDRANKDLNNKYENGFSPNDSYIKISIWGRDFDFSEIKDDVDFLMKYIEQMGYNVWIFAYDPKNRTFRDISFANENIVIQIDIYFKEK